MTGVQTCALPISDRQAHVIGQPDPAHLGDAPERGDARLLVAADVGGVRLTDNVGLPIGIGFRNIEAEG